MGYGWRMGDMASAGMLTVPTAQALRDYPVSDLPAVGPIYTRGALTEGDGGALPWIWDAAATADDNLGTVLLPTGHAGAGRFVPAPTDMVSVLRWGAARDGTTPAESAIQDALTAAQNGAFTLYFPPGDYLCEASLKVCDGTKMHFAAGATLIHGYNSIGPSAGLDATLTNDDPVNGNSDIRITGTLTMRDKAWTETVPATQWTGHQLGFYKVDGLYIEHVVVRDFRQWSSVLWITNSRIDRYEVRNPNAASNSGGIPVRGTDGLHIVGGENISIGEVYGRSGDDLVALVATDVTDQAVSGDIKNVSIGRIHGGGHRCNLLKIHVASGTHAISGISVGAVTGDAGSVSNTGTEITSACTVRILEDGGDGGSVSDIAIGVIDTVHPGGADADPNSYLQLINVQRVHCGSVRLRAATESTGRGVAISECDYVQIDALDVADIGENRALEVRGCRNLSVNAGRLETTTGPIISVRNSVAARTSEDLRFSGLMLDGRDNGDALVDVNGAARVMVSDCNVKVGASNSFVSADAATTYLSVCNNFAALPDFSKWLNNSGDATNVAHDNVRAGVMYSGKGSMTAGTPVVVTHNLAKSDYTVLVSTRSAERRCYPTAVTLNQFTVSSEDGMVGTQYFDWVIREGQ